MSHNIILSASHKYKRIVVPALLNRTTLTFFPSNGIHHLSSQTFISAPPLMDTNSFSVPLGLTSPADPFGSSAISPLIRDAYNLGYKNGYEEGFNSGYCIGRQSKSEAQSNLPGDRLKPGHANTDSSISHGSDITGNLSAVLILNGLKTPSAPPSQPIPSTIHYRSHKPLPQEANYTCTALDVPGGSDSRGVGTQKVQTTNDTSLMQVSMTSGTSSSTSASSITSEASSQIPASSMTLERSPSASKLCDIRGTRSGHDELCGIGKIYKSDINHQQAP